MTATLRNIPVVYSPKQVSFPDTFSPSPRKPALVVRAWFDAGFPISLSAPGRLDTATFELAHDPAYVAGIFGLTVRNGFGGLNAEVAESLRYTSGSMVGAARIALANRTVAVSPSSGFHHAGYDFGGGFCTFNGLMIAALTMQREGLAGRVGILDCDQHFGDGSQDILDRLMLGESIRHVTSGAGYRRDAKTFLAALPDIVLGFAGCDLLLYQAGADPHVDDPLGGWLTTRELFQRDQIVFSMANRLGIPVVWNLAGGYQDPLENVLAIHANTMRACVSEYLDQTSAFLDSPAGAETLGTTIVEK
jgi:acetoin utilization deacetylase AcuC-like enzyme